MTSYGRSPSDQLGSGSSGANKATIPLGGSCSLLLQPAILLQTNVQGTGPGNGSARFKLPLPSNPVYKGATLHFQWGIVDPAAAGIGVALSNAATLTL